MKIKGIIYDFDGVICDSVNVKTDAFAELYKPYGKEIQAKVIQYHLLHGGISRFEKIRYYHNEYLGIDINNDEVLEISKKFSLLVKDKVIQSNYILGAYDFVEKYSNIYSQFVCTGTPENEIEEIVEKRGLGSFFNGIYGSPKSKIEIIKEILVQTGIDETEMLYFGDALTDYNAAKAFKIPFIGILNVSTIFPEDVLVIPNFLKFSIEDYNKEKFR